MRSVSEKIDERILRLLGLEDVFDIDYDTYSTLLKEAIVVGKNKLPAEELAVLSNERKRVTGKTGRFKPKKEKINANKVSINKFLKPSKKVLALPAAKTLGIDKEENEFVGIKSTLDSILKILESKFKFDQKQTDKERREKEKEGRGKRESSLEGFKKGVEGIVSITKKMLSPFQAIIDRIWRFIFFTLLGKAFTKFMDWMGDKNNQKKFNAFIDFLSDHWPALAGLYILFGTGFGKLTRGLLKGITRMIVAIGMNLPKIFGFIKKNKKLSFLALAAAPLVTREISNLFTDKETPESGLIPTKNPDLDSAKKSADQSKSESVSKFNFGGMIPRFAMGGMTPFGMDFSSGVPITGAGQDNTLIAAKTGEAILTEKDQVDLSQRYVDRNTGEPLNIPHYLAGRKPGNVNFSNLRFGGGFRGGFSGGGVISKFNNGGIVGAMVGGAQNLWRSATSRFNPRPQKAGPVLTPEISRGVLQRQPKELARSAQSMINQKWSASSSGVDPRVGCAAAIKEVYKRSGINLPWGTSANPNYVPDIHSFLNKKFLKVSERDRKPGDVVVWKDTGDPPYGHIGIVMSDGRIANNSTSRGTFTNLNTPKEAKSWWPNTQQLLYFRDPRVAQALVAKDKPHSSSPRSSQSLFGNLMASVTRKKGGGLIKEGTGMNVRGATADRRRVDLQPGEYVLPVDTVNRLGVSLIDKLVAMTDSNSNPYLGRGTVRRPQITPYNSFGSSSGMMTLPPIIQSAEGSRARSAGLGGGSEIPEFSAIAPNNERELNAHIYGLVG